MKIERNKLVRVFYKSKEFNRTLRLEEDIKGLILDTIKVFGIMNSSPEKETECKFLIQKYDGKETYIIPLERFDKYIFIAERCCNANVIEIKPEDYNYHTETAYGDYRFVLNGDTKIDVR